MVTTVDMATQNILKDYKVSEVEILWTNLKNKNINKLNLVILTTTNLYYL